MPEWLIGTIKEVNRGREPDIMVHSFHEDSGILVIARGMASSACCGSAPPSGRRPGCLRARRNGGAGSWAGSGVPISSHSSRETSMNSPPVPILSEGGTVFTMFLILLIPFAMAGIALVNTGLGRSRNAAHMMMSSLCVVAIAAAAYFICGFSWQGTIGGPAHTVSIAGKSWSWLASQAWFLGGLDLNGSPASLVAWMQILCVGLAALIPLGAAAERWRLGAMCASAALLAGFTYPLFAHWAWGGGWLAQLGTNYGLGRGFVDAGGSGVIQTTGGLTALGMAWILGPRRGKYTADGIPTAIPGHNAVLVILGCLLAWAGWLGLNSAGAILFTGIAPGRATLIAVNTTLAAGSAALVAAVVTRTR